jgi:serine/threonine-protein kinase
MQFGKYELTEKMASGGMAEVFRAQLTGDSGFRKELAVKCILAQHSRSPEFVRLFINEARVAARLRHANIVQIFDFGEASGRHYIAMELVEGWNLRQVQQRTALRGIEIPDPLAVHIVAESLKALHYAHNLLDENDVPLNIVHRDVTPHNILLSSSGEVKLADFGIAKAAITTGVTAQGHVRGKLTYMAPEQIKGEPLTQKADIFSLGTILFELCTGRKLYESRKGHQLAARVRQANVPPLSRFGPIPAELEDAAMAMLSRSPDARPDALQAMQALKKWSGFSDQTLELAAFLADLYGQRDFREPGKTPAIDSKGYLRSGLAETVRSTQPSPAPTTPQDFGDNRAEPAVSRRAPARVDRVPHLSRARRILRSALAVAVVALGAVAIYHHATSGLHPSKQPSGDTRRVSRGARVRIESKTPATRLYINNLPVADRLPASVGLMPGRHVVRAVYADGSSACRSLSLKPGQLLTVHLRPEDPGQACTPPAGKPLTRGTQ